MTHNNGARVILAVANEADDDFIWDQMKSLQADMFAAGPVSIKVAYFGREGAGMTARPFISTRWATDSDDLCDLLDRARAGCVCGCRHRRHSRGGAEGIRTGSRRSGRNHRRLLARRPECRYRQS
jgi:hypothetical protein